MVLNRGSQTPKRPRRVALQLKFVLDPHPLVMVLSPPIVELIMLKPPRVLKLEHLFTLHACLSMVTKQISLVLATPMVEPLLSNRDLENDPLLPIPLPALLLEITQIVAAQLLCPNLSPLQLGQRVVRVS